MNAFTAVIEGVAQQTVDRVVEQTRYNFNHCPKCGHKMVLQYWQALARVDDDIKPYVTRRCECGYADRVNPLDEQITLALSRLQQRMQEKVAVRPGVPDPRLDPGTDVGFTIGRLGRTLEYIGCGIAGIVVFVGIVMGVVYLLEFLTKGFH